MIHRKKNNFPEGENREICFDIYLSVTHTRQVFKKSLECISGNKSMFVQNLRFRYFLLTTKKELVRIISRYPENMVEPERGKEEC